MQGVPHHMLDVADPWENFSVGRYVSQAIPIMDDILARGKLPIVAGGTGLYIDNLMAGREFAPFAPDTAGVRQQLQQQAREEGLEPLRDKLAQVDPESAQRLHPNDEKRIIRALEVYLTTGKTISQHNRESQAIPPRYHPLTIGLDFEQRPHLWQRIDRRVDVMMEQGLEDEVRRLLDAGIPPTCTAMQAIGYKEIISALQQGRPASEGAEEVKLRALGYLPLGCDQEVELIAGLGLGEYEMKARVAGLGADKEEALGIRANIGAQYNIDENWAVRGMYRHVYLQNSEMNDINEFSAGIRYNF